MKRTLAFLILALLIAAIGIIAAIESQPQRLPLVAPQNAQEPSERAQATARRLRAVPTLPDERST